MFSVKIEVFLEEGAIIAFSSDVFYPIIQNN